MMKNTRKREAIHAGEEMKTGLLDWGQTSEATILLNISEPCGEELLVIRSGEGMEILRIYTGIVQDQQVDSLIVELRTTAREHRLTLSVPRNAIGRAPHSIAVRYLGYRLELYVDGVLADEEWPMGSLDLRQAAFVKGSGALDLILYNVAIEPHEFLKPGDDEAVLAERTDRYLGTEPGSMQHWKPRGFNTGVGDCMPFFDGETFHIFYLFDRRGHRSKWGLGAHQWAHLSTGNLKEWTHHPMAVGVTADWEGSICTGSVLKEKDLYYAFYAVRAVDGSPAQITWAESTDGIHFEKTERYLILSDKYLLASVRDPHVFKGDDHRYHMLVTTSLLDDKGGRQGCLAHLTSSDLAEWKEEDEPFIVPGYHDEPECSDYFEWNGWYYLIFSNDAQARYRYSRQPFGPWLRPAMDTIDVVQLRVPKTAPLKDGRRLAVGFLSLPGQYGGELIIREIVQRSDGMLGLTFPAELTEALFKQNEDGFTGTTVEDIRLEHVSGFISRSLDYIPGEYRLTFKALADDPNSYFGFSLADGPGFEHGHDIRFDPSGRKVGVHEINGVSYRENEESSIYHVDDLNKSIRIEVIVREGFVDLCVDGKRTLISRLSHGQSYLRFFSQFGAVTFSSISIRPLVI